jgi:hypothetical protein
MLHAQIGEVTTHRHRSRKWFRFPLRARGAEHHGISRSSVSTLAQTNRTTFERVGRPRSLAATPEENSKDSYATVLESPEGGRSVYPLRAITLGAQTTLSRAELSVRGGITQLYVGSGGAGARSGTSDMQAATSSAKTSKDLFAK